MYNKFVVIDLETTGNSPGKGDKITQIAAVVIENGKITDQYTSFVNPETSIPAFIKELTGITEEMVKDAPVFSEIADEVHALIDGAYFVAHNVLFDLGFLQAEFENAGYAPFHGAIIDTVEMARILYPTADGYQLNELAQHFQLIHERPHQADSDAYVTAELFLLMIDKLSRLPENTLQTLSGLALGLKSDFDLLIDQIMAKKQMTVEEIPVHLEIYRGIALKKEQEVAIPQQKQTETMSFPLSNQAKEELFQKGLKRYEHRDGQFQMADEVHRAFSDAAHVLVEAGTGVGKTLSYLLAAAFFAKQMGKRVVVSTYTTLLQEQLMNKELPLLERMLPFPLNSVLLKGRGHYLNLEKYAQSLKIEEDNYDENLTKMQILVWLTETETGDVDELNLSSGGALYWNKIKSDEAIFLKNNRWLERDFYLKAKSKAQTADLIITNHALLVTDCVSKQAILPPYEYVVVDEAHHLADTAAKQFGYRLDYISIRLLLGKLGTLEQRQLFYQLEQLLERSKLGGKLNRDRFALNELLTELSYASEQFFETARAYVYKQLTYEHKKVNRLSFRFEGGKTSALIMDAERYYFCLQDVVKAFRMRLQLIEHVADQISSIQKLNLEEIATTLDEMENIQMAIKHLFIANEADTVTWIEMDKRSKQQSIFIIGEPVVVAPFLKERFFSHKKSVVLTSATLTVKNSFSYMIDKLGLQDFQPKTVQYISPFHFEQQVQLFIPADIPEINRVPMEEYVAITAEYILSIAEATQGRQLILFTSHEMLRSVYGLMKESGLLEDFVLLAQGITGGSRARMMRNFQRYEKAILFGTSSFWEGIDIPGEDLSCIVIVRLPFTPPDEPMFAAKSEWLKSHGMNPFSKLALPEAVLRFKQGFGRLVRTGKDRGVIVVFDRRIVTKSYGKAFLQSIPSVPVHKKEITDIVENIKGWLG